MNDRLAELLKEHERLFGVICRDATPIDIELYAQAGYQVVWMDLEHSSQSNREALGLCRTISHLGMVPMIRMIELAKAQVQQLLDGGVEILGLPDVRNAKQAAQFVELGKYPPLGKRGVSSTTPRSEYSLGAHPDEKLRELNDSTRLMVQFESEEAFDELDSILSVQGIDLVGVGQVDWGARQGWYGNAADSKLAAKVEKILLAAKAAGKTTMMGTGSPEDALRYSRLGVRILFIGPDISLKRTVFSESLRRFQGAFLKS